MCLCVKVTKGQLHFLSSSQKIGVICEEGTSSWENTSISWACQRDCGVCSWLMIDRLQVTAQTPLGGGGEKAPGSKTQPGVKWVAELSADLFNKEAGPVYIPLPRSYWLKCLTLQRCPLLIDISSHVSLHQQSLGVVASLRLAQGKSIYCACSCSWLEQGNCGLCRLSGSFSYNMGKSSPLRFTWLVNLICIQVRKICSSMVSVLVPALSCLS